MRFCESIQQCNSSRKLAGQDNDAPKKVRSILRPFRFFYPIKTLVGPRFSSVFRCFFLNLHHHMEVHRIKEATTNDVDAYRSKQKEAEEVENKAIADSITDQIVSLVRAHLENHAEDRDKILAVIKKYAQDIRFAYRKNISCVTSQLFPMII